MRVLRLITFIRFFTFSRGDNGLEPLKHSIEDFMDLSLASVDAETIVPTMMSLILPHFGTALSLLGHAPITSAPGSTTTTTARPVNTIPSIHSLRRQINLGAPIIPPAVVDDLVLSSLEFREKGQLALALTQSSISKFMGPLYSMANSSTTPADFMSAILLSLNSTGGNFSNSDTINQFVHTLYGALNGSIGIVDTNQIASVTNDLGQLVLLTPWLGTNTFLNILTTFLDLGLGQLQLVDGSIPVITPVPTTTTTTTKCPVVTTTATQPTTTATQPTTTATQPTTAATQPTTAATQPTTAATQPTTAATQPTTAATQPTTTATQPTTAATQPTTAVTQPTTTASTEAPTLPRQNWPLYTDLNGWTLYDNYKRDYNAGLYSHTSNRLNILTYPPGYFNYIVMFRTITVEVGKTYEFGFIAGGAHPQNLPILWGAIDNVGITPHTRLPLDVATVVKGTFTATQSSYRLEIHNDMDAGGVGNDFYIQDTYIQEL